MILYNCSTEQALVVWEELLAARAGTNGYGGDTAEIYAYTLMPIGAHAHAKICSSERVPLREEAARLAHMARTDLVRLCSHFGHRFGCRITIDGLPYTEWEQVARFDHRAHITVHS